MIKTSFIWVIKNKLHLGDKNKLHLGDKSKIHFGDKDKNKTNRKAAGHRSMVRFKEEYPPHRNDCPQGRKPGGSTRAEEKPLRDTARRRRGKGLDIPYDSYWGWLSWFCRTLSHFVSFKNRNHWPQFESCLKSSSDHGAICIKLDLVESKKFSV